MNTHVSTLPSFDVAHAIAQMPTASIAQSQRSWSSMIGRIQCLMLAYLQSSDEEAEGVQETLTSACVQLRGKLQRMVPESSLQTLIDNLLRLYALLKTKVALRMIIKQYADLRYPPDAIMEALEQWSAANHADVADEKEQLCHLRNIPEEMMQLQSSSVLTWECVKAQRVEKHSS